MKKVAVASVLLFSGGAVTPVDAEVVLITAEFKPDTSKPYINEFKNTTPNSGYCTTNPPVICETWTPRLFSIETGIQVNSIRSISANHSNARHGALFSAPATWKDVSVKDSRGNEHLVNIRISAVGGRYRLSNRVQDLIGEELDNSRAHNKLWGSDWGISPRPCKDSPAGGSGGDYSREYDFFWLTPVVGACAYQAKFDIPGLTYQNLNFAYEMKTPNPLKMSPGTYTGSTVYTVGPGMDFDMGDIMQPTDSTLQLDFSLTVEDVFSIEIPPGGNKIELLPQGGWQAWLQQGRKPTRLFRDQTFNIWTSSPFKMQLECGFPSGDTCALQNEKGETVSLGVGVSLPNGLLDVTGSSVSRRPLLRSGSGTERFEPTFYVTRKPGVLHFEVNKDEVEKMLRFPGQTYLGEIAVIWDSQI
ncbi:hypothetical protein DKY63_24995 [Pseudomonas putida]|uniref:Uncharacterized protein n=2 Tax=Pseudomonas putida TaxID=303 RepID=A0A2Z4RTF7_PSEPU|nr:hypothetical protein DKY63_24995 [Pseudomonas putida]